MSESHSGVWAMVPLASCLVLCIYAYIFTSYIFHFFFRYASLLSQARIQPGEAPSPHPMTMRTRSHCPDLLPSSGIPRPPVWHGRTNHSVHRPLVEVSSSSRGSSACFEDAQERRSMSSLWGSQRWDTFGERRGSGATAAPDWYRAIMGFKPFPTGVWTVYIVGGIALERASLDRCEVASVV